MTVINLKITTDPPELAMERSEELGETLNPPIKIFRDSYFCTTSRWHCFPGNTASVRMHNAFLVIPQSMMEVKPKCVKLAAGGLHALSKVKE